MANLWRAPDFDPTARERRGKQLDSIKFDEDLLASLQAPRLAKEAEASRVASAQAAEASRVASAQAAAVTKSVAGSGTVSGLSLREPPPIGEEEQKLNAEVRSSLKPLTNREAIREGRAYVPGSPMMPGPERSDLTKAVSQARAAINETRPSYTQQKTGAELLNMDPKTFDPNRKLGSIGEAIKLDAFHGAASQLMGDTFESRQAAARGAGLQYGASITAGNIGGTIGDKNAASLTQTVSGKYGSGFSTAPLVPTMKQSLGGSIASATPKPAAPTRLQIEGAAADADARAKFDQPFTLGSNVGGLTLNAGTPTLAAEAAAAEAAETAAKPAAALPNSSLAGLPRVDGQLAAPAQATAPNAAPTVATTPLRQKTALDTAFPNSALSLQLRPAAQTAAPNAAPTVATTPLRQKTALDTAFPNSALSLQLRPAAQATAPNAAPNSMEGREYGGMSAGAAQAATQEALGKNVKKGVPKFTTTAASEGIFDLSNIDTNGTPSFKRASSGLTASIQSRLAEITPVDHVPGTNIPYKIAGYDMIIDPNDPATSLQDIGFRVKKSRNPTAIQEYQDLVNFLAPAKA